ncbi:penicillin-binding transpeptidase domain-containing protein [Streptomyces sp. WMMC500]|uniref:penicillin-binding transpeptidase domain-containing protein n=1 Tax=Streptomyces sp. WMMC500 TaxID=3015154 RepID=UPI00248D3653|nr:penicillin-binding transpeptidase domain-containing protein [Streptomyces sp. WMMC500]WBB58842.1 penicillin-binding transpeptidase domain-containing protein [Streptomyces sp. WMMC500]
MAGSHRRRRAGSGASTRATRTRIAVVVGVGAAVVGAAGFGAYSLLEDDETEGAGNTLSAPASSDPVKTGPPGPKEAAEAAADFLAAWAGDSTQTAAGMTDDRKAALAGLTSYRKDAGVEQVKLTPGRPQGTKVPFSVDAVVTFEDTVKPWAYNSALEVVRDEKTGEVEVAWDPSVIHPKLAEGERLRTGSTEAPPIRAVDRNGVKLDPEKYPSLVPVIADLRERYGAKAGGKAGVKVWTEPAKRDEDRRKKGEKDDDDKAGTPETLLELSRPKTGTLKTTLDADVQETAEAAVARQGGAALVALRPSTGEVLAVANQTGNGFNTALQGTLPPGSTMKVVSASMLMDKGLAAPDRAHPCPRYKAYGGWEFENVGDDSFTIEGGTFAQSFTASCNTAFISMAEKLENDDLTNQARDVFGIGLNWQTGVRTFDGSVPVQSGVEMALSLIGQGGVRMNPLTMASVSATAKAGVFKQPYLVPQEFDGRQFATAPKTMKPSTAESLRALMEETATSGTAAAAMSGLTGVGAKTGSAEMGGQEETDAWFTAYRGDLAAAATVPNIGHGGEFAGPLVRDVLEAHGG